ncbi:hypothetical protein N8I74_12760 [Chitiniphilus purpureus]|uniref:Teneurin-like YD-shell domain-containing protein n=1 Tax=Chitiniphilus purpureus TaxID=2981137 RepID=A0ABY6DQK4_9NEIS|nr:RHS repeat-associated core domain-containing protein [Chitiniphilus sp. CD1]UXY14188.1 hypothetical protein N8I74_12760 [Chitiniphilus sp. CD1]
MTPCLPLLRGLALAAAVFAIPAAGAPTTVAGGLLPVTALDHYSEDNAASRRGSEGQAIDEIDVLTGGVRLSLPLFTLPGAGDSLQLFWQHNTLEPFTEPIHGVRVRGNNAPSQSRPPTYTLELPDGSTQLFHAAPQLGTHLYRTASNWLLSAYTGMGGITQAQWLKSPDGTVYTLDVVQRDVKRVYAAAIDPQVFAAPRGFDPRKQAFAKGAGGAFNYHLPSASVDANGNRVTYSYQDELLTGMYAADGRRIEIAWNRLQQRPTLVTSGGRRWQIDYVGETFSSGLVPLDGTVVLTQPDNQTWHLQWTNWEVFMADHAWNRSSYPLFRSVRYPTGGVTEFAYTRFVAGAIEQLPCAGSECNPTPWEPYFREKSRPALARKTTSDGGSWVYHHYHDLAQHGVLSIVPTRNSPTPPGNQGAFSNIRQVTAPSGVTRYTFFTPYDIRNCAQDVWQSGLLLEKDVAGLHTERYAWRKAVIGPQPVFFNEHYCTAADSAVPLLADQTITRNGKVFHTRYSGHDPYGRVGLIVETGDAGNPRVTRRSYLTDTGRWLMDQVRSETVHASETAPAFSSLSRDYDALGNLLRETRDGVVRSFTYQADGQLASATDPRGFTTRYSNYHRGLPRTEVRPVATGVVNAACPLGSDLTLTRTVDDYGNVTSLTNGRRLTTGYQYDAMNRLIAITPPQGAATQISWQATGRTLTRGSYSDSQSWDGFGRPVASTVNGITVTRRFDAAGRQTFESHPNQSVGDSTAYDALNRVTQVTHADGTYRSYGYSGSAVAEVNARGYQTSSFYQAFGDPDDKALIKVVPPVAEAVTEIERDLLGKVRTVRQNGVTRSWGYDSRHYLVSRTDPETGTTVLGRDAAGNLISSKVGSQGQVNYGYDAQQRLVTVSYSDGSAESVCRRYDGNGNLIGLETGTVKRSQAFDANDNLTTETLVAAGRTLTLQHEYDAHDARSAVVYPSNRRVDLAPDAFGRPTRLGEVVPLLQYNARHQLVRWQGANGRQDHTEFNARGWPVAHRVIPAQAQIPPQPVAPAPVAAPGAPPVAPAQPAQPGVPEPNEVNADQGCRAAYPEPQGSSDGAERARFEWRRNQYEPCVANWQAKGSEWRSGNGACLYKHPKPVCNHSRCHEDSYYQNALRTWSAAVAACTDDWRYRVGVWDSYHAAYATWQGQYAHYQQQQADYTARQQAYARYQADLAAYQQALAAYQQAVAAAQPLIDSRWDYDGNGNVLAITDTAHAAWNRSFGYDGLDRLTVANAPAVWGNGSLGYDGNGNLKHQAFGAWRLDYGYDASQKLKTVTGGRRYTLGYDGWGNVTTRGDGLAYQYDAAGSLRWVNKGAASQIAYTYDGGGTRVLSQGNGLNRLAFSGADGLLYHEIDLATGSSEDFIYHGRSKLADIQGSSTTWYHSDPAGSPLAATNQSGTLLWRTHYRPYGEKLVGATTENTQWFTGKPHEDRIGLSDYGARWYDPVLGRFMAIDPVDWVGRNTLHSFNRYGYANSNPLKFIDPDGREGEAAVKAGWQAAEKATAEALERAGYTVVQQVAVTVEGLTNPAVIDAIGKKGDMIAIVETKDGLTSKLSPAQKAVLQTAIKSGNVSIVSAEKAAQIGLKAGVSLAKQGNVIAALNAAVGGRATRQFVSLAAQRGFATFEMTNPVGWAIQALFYSEKLGGCSGGRCSDTIY